MNNKHLALVATVLALVILALLLIPTALGYSTPSYSPVLGEKTALAATSTIEVIATSTEPHKEPTPKGELNPALLQVCSCESTGKPYNTPRQFNADGTVIRGKVNPHDIGMCQINTDYHLEASIKMGLDIFTEAGNIAYANYLYKTQGLQPWNWSSSCWQ